MSADRQAHLPPPGASLATTFVAAGQISTLAWALGASRLLPLAFSGFSRPDGVLGWGDRPSSRRARAAAARLGAPYWSVEDGFLRSVGLGKAGAPSVSFVIDDLGVYFDARRPSRLEEIIRSVRLSPPEEARASRLRSRIVAAKLSKYNDPDARPAALGPRSSRRRILLIDQTAGDRSIEGGLASPATFRLMIETARRENPEAELIFRPHPDHAAGLAASAAARLPDGLGLRIIEGGASPLALFEEVDAIWTVSSLAGFEALLRGLPVTTFGAPFYAGWGLTDDRAAGEARQALARRAGARRTIDELVHAALIAYPVYVEPATGRAVSVEDACDQLCLWRDQARRLGRNHLCVGFSRWKRPHARAYLGAAGGSQKFLTVRQALRRTRAGDHVVVWGMKADDEFAAQIRARGARFSRIEDGFIRSFGLGSDFLFPWSLCFDDSGLYFDATRPSDLETRIASGKAPEDMIERAARLRKEIVALGLTKYNLAGAPPADLRAKSGDRPIILALGQVPDDHSIRLGMVLPKSNLDFLARVRRENPAAFLIYKEHPDVVSGNRPGRSDPAELGKLADLVLHQGDTALWIEASDHIHVMTSLAGFEALMRGKPVTCWGAPFYAGWGLTYDKVAIERRTGAACLDKLVAASLIDYSLYRIGGVSVPVSPEFLLHFLSQRERLVKKSGFRYVFAGQSYRLFAYIIAQMAASFKGARPTQLRFAAGSGWPFFRRFP